VLALTVVVPASFGTIVAVAADLTVTGFGTLGYARSDQDFQYLRYIDNSGTIKADSLVGLQAEAQFNPQWGATVQAVASAPRTRDEGHEAKIRWGFISFRPDNDWLLRVGKLRPPFFLNSQNAEVGVTYDQARLPVEVYSLSPVYDFDGGAVTKAWSLENSEWSLDAYWGKSDIKYRFHFQSEAAQPYFPEKITSKGLVLSRASGSLFLRGGAHHATVEATGLEPFVETFTPTPILAPPPFGGTLYVPTGFMRKFNVTVLTLGADWRADDWRFTAEYGQRVIKDTKVGPDSKGMYVTAARQIGKWTPYVTYARLLSGADTRALYQGINGTPVPLGAQLPPPVGSGLPANFHRILTDRISVYDQYSTMLGASYSFSATSKLKLEWMQTKVGLASSLVDGDVHNQRFSVFSVSYSASF
jgi:hypothetical protein